MRVWLINPYGPLPGEAWREYRFALLGKALAARGHEVLWWTANFSHHFKRYRSSGWCDVDVLPGFKIRLVPTTAYQTNIGLGRVRFELTFARRAYARGRLEESPGCIIGIDPPQSVGLASVGLARVHQAPLVLDVFDLWPELFTLAFPAIVRPLAPLLLSPLSWMRRHNLRNAQGVVSLSKRYLAAARGVAPRLPSDRTLVAFNGIDVARFRAAAGNAKPSASVAELRPKRAEGETWAIFAGTLGNNYDVMPLMRAAAILQDRKAPVRVLVAGEGPLRPAMLEFIRAKRLTNTSYLGTVSHGELASVYRECDIGVSAYGPGSNVGMPDKVYDYMAAGLPIVNSLRGELEVLLAEREFGVQYAAGDAESLADAIAGLANNRELRRRLASNSLLAATEFDTAIQYGRYSEFVEMIQSEDPRGGARVGANAQTREPA